MRDFFKLFAGLGVVIVLIIFSALYFESFLTSEKIEITVEKIEEMKSPDDETYYYVYTRDEIFEDRNGS